MDCTFSLKLDKFPKEILIHLFILRNHGCSYCDRKLHGDWDESLVKTKQNWIDDGCGGGSKDGRNTNHILSPYLSLSP